MPSVSPRPLSGIPHPVVGHASVGARASCPLSHRTRVRIARRGCHSCDGLSSRAGGKGVVKVEEVSRQRQQQ